MYVCYGVNPHGLFAQLNGIHNICITCATANTRHNKQINTR